MLEHSCKTVPAGAAKTLGDLVLEMLKPEGPVFARIVPVIRNQRAAPSANLLTPKVGC